jgi:uncharacterized protein YndB with AHSA1/START domain
MSEARQQAYIEAPIGVVWELLEDVDRHPEWWPRVLEIDCEDDFEPGCTYREVVRGPVGKDDMLLRVDRMEDCKELLIRCVNTGTFVHWQLAEAQEGTFVDAAFGMEPAKLQYRLFDRLAGKRYFRTWLQQSLAAMQRVAAARASAGEGLSPSG